jgi:hypothetical protein
MDDLQKALQLFRGQLGEFDNIKLLLGGGENMTREKVGKEFLTIAKQLKSGDLLATGGPKESIMAVAKIAL